jgi:hypothetical protein
MGGRLRLIRVPLCAYVLAQAIASTAWTSPPPANAEAARRFVLEFYDWYTPKALRGNAGPAWHLALKWKPTVFNPPLLRALREDSAASAKAKGDIVGLDFDPFLASQDPESRYPVGKASRRGKFYYVNLHRFLLGKPSPKPVLVAKLENHNGTWRFANFIYSDGNDLMTVLTELKRARSGSSRPPKHVVRSG